MKRLICVLFVAAGLAFSVPRAAYAQLPIVDGARDAVFGAPLAVQSVQTSFGDNLNELDAAYGFIAADHLWLMITGNVESNFNRLEIFIDSRAGGQSVFQSPGNDNANRMNGLVFDPGFTADYHLIFRRGTTAGNPQANFDFANLQTQTSSSYVDLLGGLTGNGITNTGVNSSLILIGYNDGNTAGVGGTSGAAADPIAAAAVSSGLELGIALSDLGYTGGPINIMAGINNSGHQFWSNQFLGGLPVGTGSLGGDGNGNFTGGSAINVNAIAGNQYFTVVPEPGGILLAISAVLGFAAIRKPWL